jgi:hypothetical protein
MDFYRVVHERDHWVAKNENGNFILSADTEAEAWRELEAMDREWELD